jgi:hypothetical protein
VLLILVAFVVIWVVAPFFLRTVGLWAYIIVYPSTIAILYALIVRQAWKEFPPDVGVSSQRSVLVSAAFNLICEMIPQAMKDCGWKVMQADESHGHFCARIGISRKTWGQIIQVDLTMVDGRSTNVSVRCVAPRILWDRGQNDKMVDKFLSALEQLLRVRNAVGDRLVQ